MENEFDKALYKLLKNNSEALIQELIDNMPSVEELDKIYKPSKNMNKKIKRIISSKVDRKTM